MAWNEPGDPGDKDPKDPWGRRKKDKKLSDLDQIVKNVQNKLSGVFGIKKGAPRGGAIRPGLFSLSTILVVAVGAWLLSGFYVVQQGERAVVLRFGEKIALAQPGLHWHLPFPMGRKEVVNVEKTRTIELGFRQEKALGESKVPREALMLTADENIVELQLAIQYKITDPLAYLFNISEPEITIREAAEAVARSMVGKETLDFILNTGQDKIEKNAQILLQQMLDRYHSGIQIVSVKMQQKASLPEEIRSASDDVEKARLEAQNLKSDAQAYANDIIPRARGIAARMVAEAEGYKANVIAHAEGDTARFNEILAEYAKAPAVTRERLYIETMERVLSNTTKIFVDQKGGNSTLYLPLDKLIDSVKKARVATDLNPPNSGASTGANAGGIRALPDASPAPAVEAPATRERDRSRDDQRRRETD